MPDYEDMHPGTDLLNEDTNKIASDRAHRINSLHRTVNDLVQEENKKRLQISTEISSLTKEQRKMMVELETREADFTSETAQGYNTVLKGLGRTINSLATGVKNITVDTGRATTQAIGQYGKAISEDISINKTNTIAMALSRATPLFGYFAGKFMETDVFQSAARKIKDKVGSAMQEGLSRAGQGISNVFRRGKEKAKEEKPAATISDIQNLQKSIEEKPPKLQKGGFVKEGGIVEVHPAEVVAPIDKILKTIDDTRTSIISKQLNKTLESMSENLGALETIVVERESTKKGVIETFVEEYKKATKFEMHKESFEKRLLKAVLELKTGLLGMTSRMRIAWQRTLLQHPTFRALLSFSELLQTSIISPIRFLFGVRGKYSSLARGASRTHNVFAKVSNLTALMFTTLMPKMDDLIVYTKATAEAITGQKISGAVQPKWTMFGKIKEFMTTRSLEPIMSSVFQGIVDKLNLDKDALKEAGITRIRDFGNVKQISSAMGVTKENIKGKFVEGPPKEKGGTQKANIKFLEGPKKEKKKTELESDISKIRKMKEDQEKREGPHSPSMAQNIAATAMAAKREIKQEKTHEKLSTKLQRKANKFAQERIRQGKRLTKRMKKLGKSMWSYVMTVAGFLKNLFFAGLKKVTSFFSPLLSWFGVGTGAIAGGFTKSIGGIMQNPAVWSVAGKAFGVAGAFAIGWKIGKQLDQWLGISKSFQAALNRWDEAANRIADAVGAKTHTAAITAGKGGKLGFKSLREVKALTDIGRFSKERRKAVGGWGWGDLPGIEAAQKKFIQEHIDEYLKYPLPELRLMRRKWIDEKYVLGKSLFESAEKYGTHRESLFFKYLKRHGKVASKEQIQENYNTYMQHVHTINPKIPLPKEKAESMENLLYPMKTPGMISREATTKKIEEEAKRNGWAQVGKNIGSKVEEGSKQTTAAIVQSTNVITANNNSNSYARSSGWAGAASQFSSGYNFASDITRANHK